MPTTRIFLSSTCYDLKSLREHVRDKVRELGHELLASELPSFPISPGLSTVENCKKVIREHADLLVLIVGGRRGALDPSGARSVVSAEYAEAQAKGIDCFVFVDRQVWDLMPIHAKNPDADFTPTVDHPDVFKFVAELKAQSRWIYTFSQTEEIVVTLRTQLSIYLKTLIERGRVGSLSVPMEFQSEPRSVIRLIQERAPFWEHFLTCELLENAVAAGRRRQQDLEGGLIYRRMELVPEEQTMARISELLAEMNNIVDKCNPAVGAIPSTWQQGDPVEIRKACGRLASLIDAAVGWEIELRFTTVNEIYQPLLASLHGTTSDLIDQLSRFSVEIRKLISLEQSSPSDQVHRISLTLKAPPSFDRFSEEMDRLRRKMRL